MKDETILKEKEIFEQKIAHLCNEFVECRNIHIEDIHVNYGTCNKGWFPDWQINIDVAISSTLNIPCGDCKEGDMEVIDHIFQKDKIIKKEEKNVYRRN